MSARPWMPLYIADYLADTGHLSTVEHGSYMLLIMHYWINDGLPAEDLKLARICRLTPKEWQEIKQTMSDLFDADWRHKRIDAEMAKADETISKRKAAGLAGASARYGKGSGKRTEDAKQTDRPSDSDSNSETDKKINGFENFKTRKMETSKYLWLKTSDTRGPKAQQWWRLNYDAEMPLQTNDSGKQGYRVPWEAVTG